MSLKCVSLLLLKLTIRDYKALKRCVSSRKPGIERKPLRKRGLREAERGGFEPPLRGYRKHAFQACAFKVFYRRALSLSTGSVAINGYFQPVLSMFRSSSSNRLMGISQYRCVVVMFLCPSSSLINGIFPLVCNRRIQA